MQAVKTFDSTGIAPNGRVYAADLNAIQAAAAGLTDLAQNISVNSIIVGEAGLILSRFGVGDAQISGAFRTTGILRGVGGLYPGQFTTTTRNAIAVGQAPNGLIIFNTTTNQFEWNSGSDGARVWKAVGFDPAGDLILTGAASSLDFTDQTAANFFLTAKRTADTVARIAIKEDGTIEIGPGGATARDVSLFRSGASTLSLGAAVKLIAGSGGIQFSTGEIITGTDSITGALIAAGAIAASEIANSLKPSGGAAAATEALRALGTAAGTAAAGTHGAQHAIAGADPLPANSVGASQIQDGTIGQAEMGANSVGAAQIIDGSIGGAEMAGIVLNVQGGSYSAVTADKGKLVWMTGGGTFFLPAGLLAVGDVIHVAQGGGSQVTVSGSGGASVQGNPGTKLNGYLAFASVIQISANSWVIYGNITP